MAGLHAPSRPLVLASLVAALCIGLLAVAYWVIYARSAEDLVRARAAYEQVSWISASEPDWRKEYEQRLKALRAGSGLFVAAKPQEAAGELQSKLRQALVGTGATIDSLQSSATAPAEGKLPMIRAVVTARIAAARAIDVLQAIEAIEPTVALESVDISTQSTGSPQTPERVAVMTLSAHSYVMVTDANN